MSNLLNSIENRLLNPELVDFVMEIIPPGHTLWIETDGGKESTIVLHKKEGEASRTAVFNSENIYQNIVLAIIEARKNKSLFEEEVQEKERPLENRCYATNLAAFVNECCDISSPDNIGSLVSMRDLYENCREWHIKNGFGWHPSLMIIRMYLVSLGCKVEKYQGVTYILGVSLRPE